MQHCNDSRSVNMAALLTCLLALTSIFAGSRQALAQEPAQAGALVRLPGHTAPQVLDGTAIRLGHYDSGQKLRLAVVLAVPHPAEEKQFLEDIQNKTSPLFHQFLSAEDWNARFGPSEDAEQAVVAWAQSEGLTVTHRYNNRMVVDVEAEAGTIEKALNLTINSYQLPAADGLEARTAFSNDRDPSVPANLSGVVSAVLGLNSIEAMRPKGGSGRLVPRPDYLPGPVAQPLVTFQRAATPGAKPGTGAGAGAAPAGPSVMVTGQVSGEGTQIAPLPPGYYQPSDFFGEYFYDYQALMNQGHCCNPLNNTSGHSPRESSIAIAAFGDVSFTDLDDFQATFPYLALYVDKETVDGNYVCNNSPNADDNCVEATMDTEWSGATANSEGAASDTARVVIYEGANYINSTIMDVYSLMEDDAHARTMSTSWALAENYVYGTNPQLDSLNATMQSIDNMFSAMVGQGWTLVAASGDQGSTGACNDSLAVEFPASSPNVVGAGGTSLNFGSGDLWEVAWTGGTFAGSPTKSDSCNSNGGGGTGGFSEYFNAPSYQSGLGHSKRAVPDISLDTTHGHYVYYDGAWAHEGGTSVAAPMLAGFFAQANAYLLSIGSICGSGSTACAPIGNANYPIYAEGLHPNAAHVPFYDVTFGCTTNDITIKYKLNAWCAGPGYDEATGWGSANMLQLAWAINWELIPASGEPYVTFSGPATNKWYNTNQTVNWTIHDWEPSGSTPGSGIAGETQGWDSLPTDSTTEPHGGTGDSFWDGPQFPNGATGCLAFEPNGCSGGVSQGCHTAYARGWNNQGWNTSGNSESYGPLCYDTVPPTISVALSPSAPNANGWYTQPVTITMTAADSGGSAASGVSQIYYGIGTVGCQTSSTGGCVNTPTSFTLSTQEVAGLVAFSEDKAGNFSTEFSQLLAIDYTAPVTTAGFTGALSANTWSNNVIIVLKATDNLSGVANSYYTVDGGAQTLYTGPFTIATTGTHTLTYWSVDYAGNTEKTNVNSFFIASTTTTTLTASPNPSLNGHTVTLKATVTATDPGTPTGTVQFLNGSTVLGTATLSGGSATITTTKLPVGSDGLGVIFSGTTNFINSVSPAVTEIVLETTTTTLAATPDPAVYGGSVTLTARVTPSISGTPTGAVAFYNGPTLLGTSSVNGSAEATLAVSSLAGGNHALFAVYGGDTTYNASSSPGFAETIDKAASTTVVTPSVNPSVYRENIAFTATVSSPGGTPTGTVTFLANGKSLGSETLAGGSATFTTPSLAVGSNSITASYVGSADFDASISAAVSESTKAATTTTTLTSSLNPAVYAQSVTFTATVTSNSPIDPSGTVTFLANGKEIGSASLAGGVATFKTSALAVGTSSITASFPASTDFDASTSTALSQVVKDGVTATALASSLNPAVYGQAVTFTATVTSASPTKPTGTVTFLANGTEIGLGALSNGVATFKTSSLAAGTSSITASYAGSTDFTASTSPAVSEVTGAAATTTKVASSLNPAAFGQSIALTATVASSASVAPTGTVNFLANGTKIGSASLSGGVATFKATTLAVGTNAITAVYAGTADFSTSTSTAVSEVVNAAGTTATLTSSLNPSVFDQTVTFTATVASITSTVKPTGTVTFLSNGVSLGTRTLANGVAALNAVSLPVGTNAITLTYSGSTDFTASSSAAVSQVTNAAATTTVLASSLNPAVSGQSITLTATVAATTSAKPTGSVTFLSNGTSIGTGTLTNGVATLKTTTLTEGTDSLTATYAGDPDYLTSTSAAVSEAVNPPAAAEGSR